MSHNDTALPPQKLEAAVLAKIKIYKIRDFIRYTETGIFDVDRSIKLVHEIATAANFLTEHHLLVDLSDTDVQMDFSDTLEVATEFVKLMEGFQNKIAVLIPNTEERLRIAKRFKTMVDQEGFQFNQFFDFEEAMEWLSEVT